MNPRFTAMPGIVVFVLCMSLGLLQTGAGAAEEPEGGQPNPGILQQPAQVAPTTYNVELVGQIGGPARAVAVQGDHAYVSIGPSLVVLDISDPVHPTMLGQSPILAKRIEDVYIDGRYVYVAGGHDGLRVLDISDPAAPRVVGAYNAGTAAQAVYVADRYAYLVAEHLHIVDISDPTTPVKMGQYDSHTYGDVYVVGNHAYAAARYFGFLVLDVSDPTSPTEVGTVVRADGNALVVSGNYAYVASSSGLRVIDISDPTAPAEVGFLHDAGGNVLDIYIANHYAYVPSWEGKLSVVDVSDPTAPELVGTLNLPIYARDIAVDEDYAYVATESGGLRVVDVSDPAVPVEVGAYDSVIPRTVRAAGGYAYTPCDNHLCVLDVTNTATPTREVRLSMPDGARVGPLDVQDNYLYLSSGIGTVGQMRVFDISNPTAPQEMGILELPPRSYIGAVVVEGDYAYLGAGNDGLVIADVSDPATPREVGRYDPYETWEGWRLDVKDNHAYICVSSREGVRVVNVSDPTTPVEVAHFSTWDSCDSISVAGGYAYISMTSKDCYKGVGCSQGVSIYDISDPINPRGIGGLSGTGGAILHATERYVYAGSENLMVFDVSLPEEPVVVGRYPSVGAEDIYVDGDYIYVASIENGLLTLQLVPHQVFLPVVAKDWERCSISMTPTPEKILYRSELIPQRSGIVRKGE